MIGPAPATAHGRDFTALCAGLLIRTFGLSLASAAVVVALLSVSL
jgi:hypothetical protein